MRVLAIDTALAACAAAVLETGRGIVASESLPMVRGHAEALMPLIARVMKQSDTAFRDLDRIAVTTGPGSFTGVRVGLAAARGFAVEPGLYGDGLRAGIRLENNYLVTETGVELLTPFPLEL